MASLAVGRQPDPPAVGLDVFRDDRQTYAGAPHHILWLALATVKRLEHAFAVGFGDAGALVEHIDAHRVGLR